MSPPPIEATRCQPSASAMHGDRRSSTSRFGSITKTHGEDGEGDQRAEVEGVVRRQHQRVALDPAGQLEERDDRAGEGDRADEDADHHLGRVDAEQVAGDLGLLARRSPRPRGSRSSRPGRRPGRRSCAGSRSARACRSSRPCAARQRPIAAPTTMATTSSVRPIAEMLRVASPMVAARAMAMPAMPKALPAFARLVPGQPGQAEDEQQRRRRCRPRTRRWWRSSVSPS